LRAWHFADIILGMTDNILFLIEAEIARLESVRAILEGESSPVPQTIKRAPKPASHPKKPAAAFLNSKERKMLMRVWSHALGL
jgi:hypothetical protein